MRVVARGEDGFWEKGKWCIGGQLRVVAHGGTDSSERGSGVGRSNRQGGGGCSRAHVFIKPYGTAEWMLRP